ncbi:hypothetical protein PBAL39_08851 [Pedobacter sp. BAL39]|nr:hypothetical protein PBAL39_08851 [Pedobacter sp. BAL39]
MLLAQKKTKIILQSSQRATIDAKANISYLRNPVFRQDNATLACDSAVFYESRNVFDAFDNVHINQADTINIYSKRLTYDGNTKNAHLTQNVKMIDKESILTTEVLDYNLGTKIGTYVEGGKIVNKDVTLTSKNGYYFSNSRDAYFRYNVVVVTPQTVIKSDTLRYNTLTNWTYFYGPTNIKGKDDNLYTENGAYNTKTQYAYFGKKNLYTQGSKSLKGDSLYYDGVAGYGKAVKNIVFRDTTDKTVMYGQLGFYYKIDQRTIVTKNPYIGLGTSDSVTVNNKLQPDSLWMGADTLETQMVLQKSLKLLTAPVLKKDNELGEEEGPQEEKIGAQKGAPKTGPGKQKPGAAPANKNQAAVTPTPATGTDQQLNLTTNDTTKRQPPKKLSKKERKALEKKIKKGELPPDSSLLSVVKTATDSLKKSGINPDSLLAKGVDSSLLDSVTKKLKSDTTLQKAAAKISATAKQAAASQKKAGNVKEQTKKAAGKVTAAVPGLKDAAKTAIQDSLPLSPADTIKTRVIKAYHHVRVFKSNMQARADSLFYTSADSTLRWYGSPILWAEGSQQTGDTIYLRLKDKTIRSSQVIEKGFLVNVNADSLRYNQIKGKLITGFFENGKLNRMFVDGNAESIYFNKDEDKNIYTEMNQTVSSRIKILFKEKEIDQIITIKDPEGKRTPIPELKEDVFLTGFTWKPELRPLSKKEVISGKIKPKTTSPAKKAAAKPAAKTAADKKGESKPKVPEKDKKPAPDSSTESSTEGTPIKEKLQETPPQKMTDSAAKQQLKLKTMASDSVKKEITPAPSKKQ